MTNPSSVRSKRILWAVLGLIAVACVNGACGSGANSPFQSPVPTPTVHLASPTPPSPLYPYGPPIKWSYFQLWLEGQHEESVREFIRLLSSGTLSELSSSNGSIWLVWVGQDEQLSAELMSQLQMWATDPRPTVRRQVADSMAVFGYYAYRPRQNAAVTLLTQMMCRESDSQIRFTLLNSLSYFSDLTVEQLQPIVSCVTPNLGEVNYAEALGRLDHLDDDTLRAACQTWLSNLNLYRLSHEKLYSRCMTEAQVISAFSSLLSRDTIAPSNITDPLVKTLAADGRFTEALIDVILRQRSWQNPASFEILKQLGARASTPTADRIAHALLTYPLNPTFDKLQALVGLPLSPEVQQEVMDFLHRASEGPVTSESSYAIGWFANFADKMDVVTRQQAFATSLDMWRNPDVLDPFHPSALSAVNRLAPLVGDVAVQQSVSTSLEIILNSELYPMPRMIVIGNLPNIMPYADMTTTERVVDALMNLLAADNSDSVRGSAAQTLAATAKWVKADQQMRIAQAIAVALHEGSQWHSADSADCTLHINALSSLRMLVASPATSPSVRQFVVSVLFEALAGSPSPGNCLTHFIAARGLGEASRLLDESTAITASNRLIAMAGSELTDATFVAEAAAARIEASLVLDHGQPLAQLFAHLQRATSEQEINRDGVALFLIAVCDPIRRSTIEQALRDLQLSRPTSALAAGQVLAMIDSRDRVSWVGPMVQPFDAARSISPMFFVAGQTWGNDQLLPPFCSSEDKS